MSGIPAASIQAPTFIPQQGYANFLPPSWQFNPYTQSYVASSIPNSQFMQQPHFMQPPAVDQTGVYEHMGGLSKIYQRRKMPNFDGTDLLAFPSWLSEWKNIAKYYSEEDVIKLLDEHTPKSLNLRNNETVAQCWEDLCNRYMNPNATCNQVVREFLAFKKLSHWSPQLSVIKLEAMVSQTYKALKTLVS